MRGLTYVCKVRLVSKQFLKLLLAFITQSLLVLIFTLITAMAKNSASHKYDVKK